MNKSLIISLITMTFLLSCAPKQGYLVSTKVENNNVGNDKYGSMDAKMLALIAPYKEELDVKMNSVIGYLPEEMIKERPNSSLMNFMADALLDQAKSLFPSKSIDCALMNYGGIRITSIGKGDITVGKMYELMPFDNSVVLTELTQAQAQQLFDRVAAYGGWPISDGLTFRIEKDKAVDVLINGKPISSYTTVNVVVPNYLSDGGDNLDFMKEVKKSDSNIYIRDILISYVTKIKNIVPSHEKRIKL